MSNDARRRGCVQVLAISGDDPFRKRIEDLIDQGETLVIADLTRKTDMNSLTLGQLVACREHARLHGAVIKLVVTGSQREVIVATNLDYLFETFTSEDDALDSFFPSDTTAGIP